jgi:hypothetical protein
MAISTCIPGFMGKLKMREGVARPKLVRRHNEASCRPAGRENRPESVPRSSQLIGLIDLSCVAKSALVDEDTVTKSQLRDVQWEGMALGQYI